MPLGWGYVNGECSISKGAPVIFDLLQCSDAELEKGSIQDFMYVTSLMSAPNYDIFSFHGILQSVSF